MRGNSATTSPVHPPVPLPYGAETASEWNPGDYLDPQSWRIFHSRMRSVGGPVPVRWTDRSVGAVEVDCTGTQRADGSLVEPPLIYIEVHRDEGLSSAEAREVALALLDGAAEIDEWAGVRTTSVKRDTETGGDYSILLGTTRDVVVQRASREGRRERPGRGLPPGS